MRGKETSARQAVRPEGLPEELAEFLSADTFSLMIKGESGTGKTTLALTILKALQPLKNVLYISTRTSPLQLMEYHPWIEEIFGPADALGKTVGKEGWETLVDSRLDEPNTVFERVTNVLMDEQAPTVVIDSWEALGDAIGSEALRTDMRVLEAWRERAGARFIFVGEKPENTALDYVAEGIVVLTERTHSGRRLREVTLSKLHGVQIQRPSHLFTLEGGVFRSFPRYSPDEFEFRRPLPMRLDHAFRSAKGRYPTGYVSFDRVMGGGFPPKSVVLVELDSDVDARVGLVLFSRMVRDWAAAGNTVALQSPNGVDAAFFKRYVKALSGGSKSESLVVWPQSRPMPTDDRNDIKKRGSSNKVLAVLSASADQESAQAGWAEAFNALRNKAQLTLIIGRAGNQSLLASEPSSRLKVFQIEGTLFVQGVVPWSPLFAAVPAMTAGNLSVELVPVV